MSATEREAGRKTAAAAVQREIEKCSRPATLMARHSHQGEFVPICGVHDEAAVERSEDAGKKPVPQGTKKSEAVAHSFANRDDELPLHRRALTAVERESNLRCLNHLLGAQIDA